MTERERERRGMSEREVGKPGWLYGNVQIPTYCGKNHISVGRRKSFMCDPGSNEAPKCRLY